MRALAARQRASETALDRYAYDILKRREELDRRGRAESERSRRYEVFHVEGRPVRSLVAVDGERLPPGERERERRRAAELVAAIRSGDVVTERPGVRISQILERFAFRSVARTSHASREALVLAFEPRPGDRELTNDRVLRTLAGRVFVDEAAQELLRVEVHSTRKVRFALGLAGALESLAFEVDFAPLGPGVWLPRRIVTEAAGRRFPFRRFHVRTTVTYERFRRFDVETEEALPPIS